MGRTLDEARADSAQHVRSRDDRLGATRLAGAVVCFGLLLPTMARSTPTRLRLERVDAGRCALERTVLVHAAEVTLEGVLQRRPPSEYRLLGAKGLVSERPIKARPFAATDDALAVVLVIQLTSAYERVLPALRAAARQFVAALPPRAAVSVIAYDWEPKRLVSPRAPRQALAALERLQGHVAATDPALIPALRLALDDLERQPRRARRAVIVVSDGLDRRASRDLFRGLGTRAAQTGAPIFPIAFSPIDERGPLLNLGELAKRSYGTFRWARSADQIDQEMEALARELSEQLVLTFRVPACALDGPLRLAAGALLSNPSLPMSVEAGAMPDRRRHLRTWIHYVAFAALLVLASVVLLLAARWMLSGERARERPRPAGRTKRRTKT